AVHVIDAEDYANPTALPPGNVLVVGSGQTGCQLAEELSAAGRGVSLACGRAPWIPRRIEGRDTIAWLNETSWFEIRLSDLPSPAARLLANPQMSGGHGGHDLNYRTLQAQGDQLLGRFIGVADGRAYFGRDLAQSAAFGDARNARGCAPIIKACAMRSVATAEMPAPAAVVADPPDCRAL